jgi:hypothetical protein
LTDAGEEIRVAHRKRMDIRVRQAVIDGSPAYAVVGGKKDAATSIASKEILPAYGIVAVLMVLINVRILDILLLEK